MRSVSGSRRRASSGVFVDVAVRLSVAYVVVWLVQYLVTSQSLAPLYGRPALHVGDWPAFYDWLRPLLLATFFVSLRRHLRALPHLSFKSREVGIGATVSLVTIGLVITLLHPTASVAHVLLQHVITPLHPFRAMFFGGVIWLLLTLPLIPLLFTVLPWELLRPQVKVIASGVLLYAVLLCGEPLNAAFVTTTQPTLVRASHVILGLLTATHPVNISNWVVSYQGFSVTIGYACNGFTAFFLLFGMLAFVWHRYPPRGLAAFLRYAGAALLAAVGLFALNAFRIAAIVIVGSRWPSFALGLFHSSFGGVLLFAYVAMTMMVMARIASPRTRAP